MTYLDLIRKRTDGERRFTASLHDKQLPDERGAYRGVRQSAMERMKQRRRGGH